MSNILMAIDGLRPARLTREYREAGEEIYDQVAPFYTGEESPSTDILEKLSSFVHLAEFITTSYMALELAVELSVETPSDFKKSIDPIAAQFRRVFPGFDAESFRRNKVLQAAEGEPEAPESLSVSRSVECLKEPVEQLPDVLRKVIPVLEELEADGAGLVDRARGIQYLIRTRSARIRKLLGQIGPDHAESARSDHNDGRTVTLEQAFGRLGD